GPISPEVSHPDKAALLEIQPGARRLGSRQPDRADVRRHQVGTVEQRVIGEPDEPYVRHILLQPADARLRQLGEAQQEVTLTPGIVRVPARAVRLAPDAGVEDVAAGNVAIGQLQGWNLHRVPLLTAETLEAAKD